jgi:hypothetical protein
MTRVEWLVKKHSELDLLVTQLESERLHNRSSEHKALLQLKKKEKLATKTELNRLRNHEQAV